MLRNIGTALAKAIRRHNEEGSAIGEYLTQHHDREETALLREAVREIDDLSRRLNTLASTLERLQEIDAGENRMHCQDRRGHVAVNQALAMAETQEPPVQAAVLMAS